MEESHEFLHILPPLKSELHFQRPHTVAPRAGEQIPPDLSMLPAWSLYAICFVLSTNYMFTLRSSSTSTDELCLSSVFHLTRTAANILRWVFYGLQHHSRSPPVVCCCWCPFPSSCRSPSTRTTELLPCSLHHVQLDYVNLLTSYWGKEKKPTGWSHKSNYYLPTSDGRCSIYGFCVLLCWTFLPDICLTETWSIPGSIGFAIDIVLEVRHEAR
jgi:hypothetical protein